jgi:hypothetical protein
VTQTFEWQPTFGPANLPTARGTYTYTVHYYRQVDLPQNDIAEFGSPDIFCNRGYGLRNQDPRPGWENAYLEEFCSMDETFERRGPQVQAGRGRCACS